MKKVKKYSYYNKLYYIYLKYWFLYLKLKKDKKGSKKGLSNKDNKGIVLLVHRFRLNSNLKVKCDVSAYNKLLV